MSRTLISNPFDEDERSGRRPVVWAVMGVGVLCLCSLIVGVIYVYKPDPQALISQYFPSSTPAFTRTPTLTPTSTPTATPNITATARAALSTATAEAVQTSIGNAEADWNILLADSFDSNLNFWSEGNDQDKYATITYTVEDGAYKWDIASKMGVAWRLPAPVKTTTDFMLTVKAQRTGGTGSSDFGLIFRDDGRGDFYYFGIDDERFHVSLLFDDTWEDVIDWTASDAILPGSPNRLTVFANGSFYVFLINDQIVGEATDDHIDKGLTGLGIQIFDSDMQATFEFDEFELREP